MQLHATELQPGKPIEGTFSSASDVDWYRLSLPAVAPGDFLRIEVTIPVELEVRALSDGALLWSKRTQFVRDLSLHLGERPAPAEIPDGGDDAGFFHLPEPAGYYLVLKSRTAGAYTLTAVIESGPPDIEQEPNDDRQHANPVQTSATGAFRFFAAPGDWTLRTLTSGSSVDTAATAVLGEVVEITVNV